MPLSESMQRTTTLDWEVLGTGTKNIKDWEVFEKNVGSQVNRKATQSISEVW
jgi:hypothetical protein